MWGAWFRDARCVFVDMAPHGQALDGAVQNVMGGDIYPVGELLGGRLGGEDRTGWYCHFEAEVGFGAAGRGVELRLCVHAGGEVVWELGAGCSGGSTNGVGYERAKGRRFLENGKSLRCHGQLRHTASADFAFKPSTVRVSRRSSPVPQRPLSHLPLAPIHRPSSTPSRIITLLPGPSLPRPWPGPYQRPTVLVLPPPMPFTVPTP